MVNSSTVPFGTPCCTSNSGARGCVGPMMKLPSTFAGGTAPSASSFAATYPGPCGSRVGLGARTGGGAAAAGAAGGAGGVATWDAPCIATSTTANPATTANPDTPRPLVNFMLSPRPIFRRDQHTCKRRGSSCPVGRNRYCGRRNPKTNTEILDFVQNDGLEGFSRLILLQFR